MKIALGHTYRWHATTDKGKFATIPIVFFKSITLDMHHHKTYMYINYQQKWVSRSVKTVHTNIFAKNCKLHKFATNNSNFEKIKSFYIHHYKTYMYINFQQNRVSRIVKTLHTNIFSKKLLFT